MSHRAYTGLYRTIPDYTGNHRTLYRTTYRNIPDYTGLCTRSHRTLYRTLYRNIPETTGLYRSTGGVVHAHHRGGIKPPRVVCGATTTGPRYSGTHTQDGRVSLKINQTTWNKNRENSTGTKTAVRRKKN